MSGMKIHAYRVVPSIKGVKLSTLLEEINQLDLPKRAKAVAHSTCRIEHIEKEPSGRWCFDVGKFRYGSGPGAASKTTAIRGFEFKVDEEFCEETAVLYSPAKRVMLVQYNHAGARAGLIQEYLSSISVQSTYAFELRPIYRSDVGDRLSSRAATMSLDFTIDTLKMTKSDRTRGVALGRAIDLGRTTGGNLISLRISGGHSGPLRRRIDATVSSLTSLAEARPDAVSRLKVGIKPSLDAKTQILDLLAEREVRVVNTIDRGPDRRLPRDERYRALRGAFDTWTGL